MFKVGVLPGKFSPPHKGHIDTIINASTQCEKLYVVVSSNEILEEKLYRDSLFNPISLIDRAKCLSIELQEFEHIEVVCFNEDDFNIPPYPNGWVEWSATLRKVIKEPFDAIFGDNDKYAEYFPEATYVTYDIDRNNRPISATQIRKFPFKYWDYILKPARLHFATRILITGTESCGKTTLTKYLAKIFSTSWAHEEGRYYCEKYLGGNEQLFQLDDFYQICLAQQKIEQETLLNANKVAFFDTDNIITQYYCEMYTGEKNPQIEELILKEMDFDIILFLTPDVKWVPDGARWQSEDTVRWELNEKLKQMYFEHGYRNKIIEINGNYQERLHQAINIVNQIW